MSTSDLVVVPGSAHRHLARQLAASLDVPQLQVEMERFPDGELTVRLLDSPRGRTAVIVQPTGPPVDQHVIELLALADACRRGAASRVIAVVPYFGYARGDRRAGERRPIMASLVAHLLEAAGVAHVITVDLHAPQIEGFFEIPLDDLVAYPVLLAAVRESLATEAGSNGIAVVSPDLGRLVLATKIADELQTNVAVVHKRRASGSEAHGLQVVGEVVGRSCLIIDDMITTGGTIRGCVEALLQAGARPEMFVAATHGLFTRGAADRLRHPAIRRVWITDTLPQAQATRVPRMVVPIAPLLADALARLDC
jgi:ribose-phosphate pyrophosphokinase